MNSDNSTEQQEQQERARKREQAAERRRQRKEQVQAEVLAEIVRGDENAHQQLRLAQQLATAVINGKTEAVGQKQTQNQQPSLALANSASTVVQGRGRPSDYTDEEADVICAWIAEGRSLRSYCRLEHRGMDTVYRWLRERRDFRERYARAHEDRADSLADEITDIADEVASASMEEIQAARLRVDARKWVAAKLKPTKWGDYQTDTAKTNVVFNIGIGRTHAIAPTPQSNPLKVLESSSDI